MKRLLSITAGVLLLTGCTAAPDIPSNEAACEGFASLHSAFVANEHGTSAATNSDRLAFRADFRGEVDALSLASAGDVKERLNTLVEALPADGTDLLLSQSDSYMAYVANADRVVKACGAEGVTVELDDLR